MSDKKFDDKIREALEGHEPDVQPNWGRMKERIAAAAAIGAIGVDVAGSKIISQLSIGFAVVVGAASMWFAQQYILPEDKMNEEGENIELVSSPSSSEKENTKSISGLDNDAITFSTELKEPSGNVHHKNEKSDRDSDINIEKNAAQMVDNDASRNPKAHLNDEVVIIPKLADVFSDELMEKDNLTPDLSVEVDLPFEASVKEACVGVEVDFKLDINEQNMSFLWNFGDGSFSSEAFPSHVYNEEGVFDVTLSVRSPGAGSIQTRTIRNLIEVHSQPEAKMNFHLPRIVLAGSLEVELTDETVGSNSSTWVVDGEASSNNKQRLKSSGSLGWL